MKEPYKIFDRSKEEWEKKCGVKELMNVGGRKNTMSQKDEVPRTIRRKKEWVVKEEMNEGKKK